MSHKTLDEIRSAVKKLLDTSHESALCRLEVLLATQAAQLVQQAEEAPGPWALPKTITTGLLLHEAKEWKPLALQVRLSTCGPTKPLRKQSRDAIALFRSIY